LQKRLLYPTNPSIAFLVLELEGGSLARLGNLLRHLKSAIWHPTVGNRARQASMASSVEEPADAADGACIDQPTINTINI
jgi:hypothetical protein